ncbi:MAG: hypothetical protein AUJ52_11325 [Elusimicrobia bacterium CG1_02_63_36]|nr:MAG: hypothetical protein AUJ52_11325 [Elusimicrobia bacterium CG1_02_63_36]PIP82558.1 MAG: hypothetical protein COR54_14220 [Elusimicrobia bacterium CG22_combo_CG10-13_8_21_14_all_63_91]PJA12937.1 MAG: hypothetical protein COX66_16150 [Elusimicrobia bacterium CG_4_10_14_0_2_um_filter_63_34]PJB25813.1 MAG: hypothetical protein CO113_06595 [Elusimicrobia bacterium CG_4_9_14_3_um_filter_62_55]
MDKIIPISALQSQAKKFVEQVRRTEEAVVVTQRGKAAAVLLSYESYEGFLAARDELTFPDWSRRLERANREAREGKGVSLESYRAKRRTRG